MRGAASQRNKSVIRGRLVTAAASQTVARSNCRIRRPLTILSAVRPQLVNSRGAFDISNCLFPSAAVSAAAHRGNYKRVVLCDITVLNLGTLNESLQNLYASGVI